MEINKKGFTKRKLSYGVILFRTLFILIIGIAICLLVELCNQKKECVKTLKNEPKIKCDTITSWITVYHPTIKECGSDKNITRSGKKGIIGSVACSTYMFDFWVNMFDTVQVISGNFKGNFVVYDKGKNPSTSIVELWRPVGDSLKGCYKSKIIIKKHK